MKKAKVKSLIRSVRKTAADLIAGRLVTVLQETSEQFGKGSKTMKKEIKKGAERLAKKIAAEIQIDEKSLAVEESAVVKTEKAPVEKKEVKAEKPAKKEKPAEKSAKVKAVPAAKSPEKK